MKISPAAKVGVATVLGLALSVMAIGWLTQFRFKPQGYGLKVVYTDISGLMPGANVMLMGVRIGRVSGIDPHERTVTVDVEIQDPSIHLLKGSRFKILTKGIVGEKNLEIFPPVGESNGYIQPDSTVRGEDPARLDVALEKANKLLATLEQTTSKLDIGDRLDKITKRLDNSFANLDQLLGHTDDLVVEATSIVERTSAIADQINDNDLRQMANDLRVLVSGLRRSYETTLGAPESAKNMRDTLASIRNLSAKLESMATSVERIVENPQLKKDVEDVVSSSKSIISLVGRQRTTSPVSPHLSIVAANQSGSTSGNMLYSNFGLRINFPDSYFDAGIEELGENNRWNLVWGRPHLFGDKTGYHIGLIRSKIGGGLDYRPDQSFSLTGEFYDPLAPEMRLGLSYFPQALEGKYGFYGQWQRALISNDTRMLFGFQWRPLD